MCYGWQYSTDYDEEKNCCVCLAQKDFKKGDQFTIYYGKRHNVELFLHNGFVEIGEAFW